MKATHSSHRISLGTHASRITALSLLTLGLTGCKNEPPMPAAIDPAGVYTLVSVDGQGVPCSVKHGGAALSIKSGVFTITPDGRCRSLINFSVPERGDVRREVNARYTRKGAELTMQWEGAGLTKGRIKANQFNMTNEGMVFSYEK